MRLEPLNPFVTYIGTLDINNFQRADAEDYFHLEFHT